MNKISSGNDIVGQSLDFAYRFERTGGFAHRFHLGALGLKGKPGTGLEGSTPKHLMLGYDAVQSYTKWTFYGGLMAFKWKQDDGKITDPNFGDFGSGTANTNNKAKGTKLGARVGVEYAFTSSWRGVLGYNQTEFNKKYQPGWWNLGVTYRF
jgi:opacity protein-like surface antigen